MTTYEENHLKNNTSYVVNHFKCSKNEKQFENYLKILVFLNYRYFFYIIK